MSDRLEAAIRELAAAIRAEVAVRPDAPDELLAVDEAARRLGCGRSSLYGELSAGRLRSVQIGRRRLIPSSAIADRIAAASR
jgi:excisionase family DNA binding protein